MRITDVRASLLKERVLWARDIEHITTIRSAADRPRRDGPRVPIPGSVLVEIETDEGLIGVGLGGGGLPGQIIIETYLKPMLLEQQAGDIERLWELMYQTTVRYGQAGIVLMAMSGVDLALWDLKGKAMGQPVYRLIGGQARESAPVYATIRDAIWAHAQGFCGIKLGGPYGPSDGREGMRKNEAFVAETRERIGPDMDIMIDCARTWTVAYTIEMARSLAPYRIAFVEEPVGAEDVDGYATIRRRITTTLIAGGEHAYTRHAVRRFLERGALDIVQPDIRWTGGLSEVLKICDLAAAFHIPVMPHRGGMAWSLPVLIARAECSVAEGMVLTEQEATYSVFDGEPVPQNGRVAVSEAPGFGLTLQRERLAAYLSNV